VLQVVHGDLKPANVLLIGRSGVKLADFGLRRTIEVVTRSLAAAKLKKQGAGAGAGTTGGTLLWSAPEMLRAWGTDLFPDPRPAGDIYAFALVLYQLLTGAMPYDYALRKGSAP
jgi:serine/threonine protein kinase